jgi:diguanylate cyclase (GGDEF)-like protein
LLIVDDEAYLLPTLSALLARDFEVLTADSAATAQQIFALQPVDLILTDQRMPRVTGTQLLEWVRQHYPKTVRLLMTGYAELEDAIEAINRGHVYHYLMKPWRTEELFQVLRNAADRFLLERSREQLLEELRRLNLELEQRVLDRTRQMEETNRLLQQRSQELEDANRQLQERGREVVDANHQLQQRTRELEMLALTDPLTGLLNRRAIDDVARSELKRHARYPSALAVGLIDADHFREINRVHLYPGGDQALIHLARTLTGSLRTVDSVGRVGGEEFLIVCPETNFDGGVILGERIRATVERSPAHYNGQDIPLTVSIGIAVAEAGVGADHDRMRHVAAEALGQAKADGRNRCVVRHV